MDLRSLGARLERGGSVLSWTLWHAAVLAALLTVPVHIRLGPVWRVEPGLVSFMVGMGATYVVSAVALFIATRGRRHISIGTFLWCVIVPMSAFFLQILALAQAYPRTILIFFVAAAPVALLVSVLVGPPLQAIGSAGLAAAVAIAVVAGLRVDETGIERRVGISSAYSLEETFYRGYFGTVAATGGAIERLGTDFVLALADGRIQLVTLGPDDLEAVDLGRPVPMNRDEFLRAAEAQGNVDSRWFRTNDILLRQTGDRLQLFASHHYWDPAEACATTRVSLAETVSGHDLSKAGEWRTIFEATPCLQFKDRGNPFGGHFSGGKLAFLDPDHLLLTTGDHEFDGFYSDYLIAQDDSASYGKTILIDLASGTSRVFTKGHRNPQGLYVDPQGTIWLTEQGPRGGDELNRLVDGANYGWPLVTYGAEYSLPIWPLSLTPGRHDGYEPPTFSWTPSIGVSALVGVESGIFDFWRGDLIAASLQNRSLWRLRLDGDRVAVAEPIHIEERIRDLVFGPEGELVLLTEGFDAAGPPSPALVVLRPLLEEAGDMSEGERGAYLFAQCSGCHPTDPAQGHGIGPNLVGVVGRPVAVAPGFGFSESLLERGGVWTESRLDQFVANPRVFAPGTAMEFAGIDDPSARAALLGYLRTLTPESEGARAIGEAP